MGIVGLAVGSRDGLVNVGEAVCGFDGGVVKEAVVDWVVELAVGAAVGFVVKRDGIDVGPAVGVAVGGKVSIGAVGNAVGVLLSGDLQQPHPWNDMSNGCDSSQSPASETL